MTWWSWMVLGALLLGAELFAIDAQFYLVFLGLSAGLVGLAGMIGITMSEPMQWIMFSSLALISMFTFRKSLHTKIRGNAEGFRDSIAGDSVKMTSDLAPGADARLAFRGSEWTVLNVGDADIAGGSNAKIVKVDGLTLHVSAE